MIHNHSIDSAKGVRVAFVLDRTISYERDLIMGILQYSRLFSHWDFFLQATEFWETDKKGSLINELKNWRPDCIVMNDNYFVSVFCEWGIPLFVSPCKELMCGVINIIADDEKIGRLGAQYFIDKGFKTLAFYGTDKIFWSKIRKTAYKDLVLTSGLNYFEFDASMENNWEDNQIHLAEWINKLPKPAAVMACQDEFGSHLIIAAKDNGIGVPQDLAILGVDNDVFICKLYDPPMSSIDQVSKNVGYKVGQCIKSIIIDGFKPTDNIIGTDFYVVTRQSTDIFAVEDTQILKALQFINANTGNKLVTVDAVVSSTSLSRRVLEIRFRKLLNRSILEEIKKVRNDSICQKLRFTNIPISEIAYSLGYNSISSFSNYFKKENKFSPLEFRKQFQSR